MPAKLSRAFVSHYWANDPSFSMCAYLRINYRSHFWRGGMRVYQCPPINCQEPRELIINSACSNWSIGRNALLFRTGVARAGTRANEIILAVARPWWNGFSMIRGSRACVRANFFRQMAELTFRACLVSLIECREFKNLGVHLPFYIFKSCFSNFSNSLKTCSEA